ncbi:hypothetical protein LWI28_010428 [Acer negundo]|uniref:GATA-type domain-containing protein n=1 Tax=Acer negundo TaxID=4023 RepID=A0AAD5JIY5_ACENE|nr:hypothetical protein LWI28_010428 [Acer negundo]KAK4856845.1 hypothetical protein QYF36_021882 [Acer negundo]
MLDPCEKGSESDGSSKSSLIDSNINNNNQVNEKKTCADCGTTKTPLWRGGPAGPKSLCNACGIRSRKKRRAVLGINKEERKPRKHNSSQSQSQSCSSNNNNNNSNSNNSKLGESLKERLMALGREVLMQKSTVEKQRKKKLGEEEQAAVLLMALSYGSVYA